MIDETHDPALTSWIDGANAPSTDFPIQNLPFGVYRREGTGPRTGVAIGDAILDLEGAAPALGDVPLGGALNDFMGQGRSAWRDLRHRLSKALTRGSPKSAFLADHLVPMAKAEMCLPATIGDYTDFYASVHHATNVGALFRPDNPLLPNYKWVPIAYHGRSSSVMVSGRPFRRPRGQVKGLDFPAPSVQASRRLDHEFEIGVFVGPGNDGAPIPVDRAEDHIFGLVLLNDWSARDIQGWEYQPLGPFLAKNFATTISPWVVTLEALAPFRAPWTRAEGDPPPLPYLDGPTVREGGNIDLALEAHLTAPGLPAPHRLSRTTFPRAAYWTIGQMLAHHTVNGCPMRPGDLFGTGTMSGPDAGEEGSLLEITGGGKRPITLADGRTLTFLGDGDGIALTARAEREGFRSIGFGACAASVLPALEVP